VHAVAVGFLGCLYGDERYRCEKASWFLFCAANHLLYDDENLIIKYFHFIVNQQNPPTNKLKPDNPEWTVEDFAHARTAHEVLPEIFSKSRTESLLKRERPKVDVTKV